MGIKALSQVIELAAGTHSAEKAPCNAADAKRGTRVLIGQKAITRESPVMTLAYRFG